MNRMPVESSNLRSVGFDAETQTMEIEFKNGGVYQYANIEEKLFDEFLRSNSKGQFFHQNFKSLPFTKVSGGG